MLGKSYELQMTHQSDKLVCSMQPECLWERKAHFGKSYMLFLLVLM